MYERGQRNFFWKGMKRKIQNMVSKCDTYQFHNGEMTLLSILIEPFTIPTWIWIENSMDLTEGIPKIGWNTMILVVVDRVSKYTHFCALVHTYTASSTT